MIRFLSFLLLAFIAVCFRRSWHGPRRPTWSFAFEVLVTAMQRYMRSISLLPVPELRRRLAALRGRMVRGVVAENRHISGVPVTWFDPGAGSSGGRLLLYAHGGGRVAGSASQDRWLISTLSASLAVPVAAVDYRLAPEATCPADVQDLLAVYSELRARWADIIFVGLSGGSAAVLSALIELRVQRRNMPSRAILLSPPVDASATRSSWRTNADADYGVRAALLHWSELYAGGRALDDPLVSPIEAPLHGLPPLLVIAGEAELLRDDAIELARRAEAAGVDVTLRIELDQPHAFMALGVQSDASRRAFDAIRAFIG